MEELSKEYRFKGNPEEEKFFKAFVEHTDDKDIKMSQIVFPSLDGRTPVSFLDEREMQIVKNTIQWLGSPVGQGFLRDLGYKKV
jgi:hypothetical protein